MTPDVFNYIDLVIKLVGLVVIIFGFGKVYGTFTSTMKSLGSSISETKEVLKSHVEEDGRIFHNIDEKITDIRVNVAKVTHGN